VAKKKVVIFYIGDEHLFVCEMACAECVNIAFVTVLFGVHHIMFYGTD
jgi:hypothetical protein